MNARNHHGLIMYMTEIDLNIVFFSFYLHVQYVVQLLLGLSIVKFIVVIHFNVYVKYEHIHCNSIHSRNRNTGKLFLSGLQNCIMI